MQHKDIENNENQSDLVVQDSEEKINAVLEEVIPDPKKRLVAVTQVMEIKRHSGPLPSPDQLKEYAGVDGALPIILSMAVKEQSFRHKITYLQMIYPYFGLLFGFCSFLACICGACYLAYIGYVSLAATLIGVTTLGVIALMIKGRISDSKNKEKEDNQNKKKIQNRYKTKK